MPTKLKTRASRAADSCKAARGQPTLQMLSASVPLFTFAFCGGQTKRQGWLTRPLMTCAVCGSAPAVREPRPPSRTHTSSLSGCAAQRADGAEQVGMRNDFNQTNKQHMPL
eukprot:362665-Chlamydomonas_euryale.AAC.3